MQCLRSISRARAFSLFFFLEFACRAAEFEGGSFLRLGLIDFHGEYAVERDFGFVGLPAGGIGSEYLVCF